MVNNSAVPDDPTGSDSQTTHARNRAVRCGLNHTMWIDERADWEKHMRTRSLLAFAAVAALATVAPAETVILEDGINATITQNPNDDVGGFGTRDVGIVYDSLAFEGNVQTPTTGPAGQIVEDYASTITSPSTLAEFQFVGGVEVAQTVIFFNFFDTSSVFVDGFGVRLPSAGFTSVWTITITDPTSVDVPDAGFLQLLADDGTNNNGLGPTNAAWRFKDVAPAIGSTTGDVHRMTINVIPEPASMALLALGGLTLLRRRG